MLILAWFWGATAYPQGNGKDSAWHSIDAWRQPQGLPQNSVLSLLQTRDGYLWVGTKGGVTRFDGAQFTTFDDRNKEQLRENEVWALAEGSEGSLWIGTYGGGVSHFKQGKFTVYTAKDGLANDYVTSLCRDSEGAIWIGTDGGVSRFKDGRFTTYTVNDGLAHNAVKSLYADRDGSVWIGTNKSGLHQFKDGRLTRQVIQPLSQEAEVKAILRARNQTLWVGTSDGVVRLHAGGMTKYAMPEGLFSERVNTLFEDAEETLWIGTDRGLNTYRDGAILAHHLRGNASSADTILALCSDHEGSLWLGFRNEGLGRLRRGQFVSYTVKNGLADDYVSSVLQDKYGHLWMGTFKGLNLFRDGEFTTFVINDTSFNNRTLALATDRASNLWVGTASGLYKTKLDAECNAQQCRPQFRPLKGAPPNMFVRVIYEDRAGALWIGLNLEGLVKYKDGQFTSYTKKDGLSNQAVRALCEGQDGSLWIGTRGGGLNRFKDGKFTTYTEKDGLASDGVQGLYLDQDQALWIATRHGLSRFKDERFTTYTMNEGLYSNFIHGIVEGDDGRLWMGCSKGIFWVRKQQLNDFADGKIRAVASVAYGREHGLSSTIGSVGSHPVACKAADGKVWFGTYGGVSFVDPTKLTTNTLAPPVHIEEVGIDQRIYDPQSIAEAAPGRGDLVFRYTGLSFLAPEKVKFKYRLEGYDADWVDAGGRRAAYYSNIPPGRYTFRVIAANNDGVWNEGGAAYTINLAPYFYQTNWFYALCLCVLVFIGVGGDRLRIRRVKVRERELSLLVDERTQNLQQEIIERQRAEEAMRESRAMFQQLFESSPDATVVVNSQRQIVRLNTQAEAMFGYGAEELLGQSLETLIPESVRESHQQHAEGYLAHPAVRRLSARRELRGRRKDGSEFPADIMLGPLDTENGLVVLGVVRDITERKQAERALQQAKEAAEAANRSKSEFLANMSHEIRTPMNAVIGMTGLLLDTELEAEQREFVEIVRTSGDALLTIINDILDFSKIESGKLDLERHPFSLSSCIEEALDLLSGKAAEKGLELAYLLDENTPHDIVGDVTRLRQILVNLLSNAVKFTNSGEVVISVSSQRLEGSQHELQFAVRDTGIGIPQDRLDRLFKSFSQVDSSTTRQYGGTGLGLAISKRLSEMMGGTIWVESQSGEGATFYFKIQAASAPTSLRSHLKREQPALTGKRLLIVDDNATNRQILTLQAQSWSMLPNSVTSGAEALELVRRGARFDVAALDLHMPEMDGVALAKQLKTWEGGTSIPLMILLSSGITSRRELAALGGADLFAGLLAKPVKPAQLYDLLVKVITEGASPAKPEMQGTKQTAPEPGRELITSSRSRILLAEDNVVNQKVALRMLERLGYRADIVANGVEVLEALSLQPYDIILMDVMMPEMDGLETSRQIRQRAYAHRPCIIAMTANVIDGDRERCLTAGMDDYVSKPVQMAELQAALERAEQQGASAGAPTEEARLPDHP